MIPQFITDKDTLTSWFYSAVTRVLNESIDMKHYASALREHAVLAQHIADDNYAALFGEPNGMAEELIEGKVVVRIKQLSESELDQAELLVVGKIRVVGSVKCKDIKWVETE